MAASARLRKAESPTTAEDVCAAGRAFSPEEYEIRRGRRSASPRRRVSVPEPAAKPRYLGDVDPYILEGVADFLPADQVPVAGPQMTLFQGPESFLDALPRRPYCTDNLDAGLMIRPRGAAVLRRYLQPNGPVLKCWLPVDLDIPHSQDRWRECGLKAPQYVTATPGTGKPHYLWQLAVPLNTGANGRPGPVAYAAAIHRAIVHRLGADPGYTGLVTKNPWHIYWERQQLHDRAYTLAELADGLDLKPANRNVPRENDVSFLGRNCTVFDTLRRFAYSQKRHFHARDDYDGFMASLADAAQEINDRFEFPLASSEIGHTVRSVGKWTWARYEGRGRFVDVGAMGLAGSGLPLVERQRLAAARTNHLQAQATAAKIVRAVQLDLAGIEAPKTISAIARAAGVKRDRVYERAEAVGVKTGRQRTDERAAQIAVLRAEGKTWKEVAAALGVSEAAAKMAAQRAKRRG